MKIPGEKKEIIYKTTYELAGVKCDICGRVIKAPSETDLYNWFYDKYKYYAVTTGHHDWGNDSYESVEHYDICPECMVKFVSEYLNKMRDSETAYIEINTRRVYFNSKVDEDEL